MKSGTEPRPLDRAFDIGVRTAASSEDVLDDPSRETGVSKEEGMARLLSGPDGMAHFMDCSGLEHTLHAAYMSEDD